MYGKVCKECGKKGKHSHSMKNVISGIYSMKGENYLSPTSKSAQSFFPKDLGKGGFGY